MTTKRTSREPTQEMLNAGWRISGTARAVWQAMHDVAPEAADSNRPLSKNQIEALAVAMLSFSGFKDATLAQAKEVLTQIAEHPRFAAPEAADPEMEKLQYEMRHVANEWADMATNGIQWVRNIIDGASTPEEALASLLSDLAHCKEVSKKAAAIDAARKGQQ